MLDFRDCPFMWPFCRQPLYAHAMPLMFNATVLNGMGLTGAFLINSPFALDRQNMQGERTAEVSSILETEPPPPCRQV